MTYRRKFIASLCFVVAMCRTIHPAVAQIPASDDIKTIMKDVQAAYDHLKSLEISGTSNSTTESDGIVRSTATQSFAGVYKTPNKFRFELTDEIFNAGNVQRKLSNGSIIGCTGTLIYADRKNHTERVTADVPAQKIDRVVTLVGVSLNVANCAPIYFAAYKDAAMRFSETSAVSYVKLSKGPDAQIDGKDYLVIVQAIDRSAAPEMHRKITLMIDRETHMVRRVIEESEIVAGTKLSRTIDITATKIDGDVNEDRFKWTVPPEWTK